MSQKMEEVLGLGSFDAERKIPGTFASEGREYRYVSCNNNANIAILFTKVIREINPPLVTSGGAVNEGCKIILPSGECYFAISYKSDIDGWRQQVEQGAVALGLLVARVFQDKLLLSDGTEVLLSECKYQFY